jgi:hypothetical protein
MLILWLSFVKKGRYSIINQMVAVVFIKIHYLSLWNYEMHALSWDLTNFFGASCS